MRSHLTFVAWIAFACLLKPAASSSAADAPSFSRHVVPLLSRLGCNSGSCHGAVQGQNGFRLSLFAAHPLADFEQIRHGAAGRRINLVDPARSLLLMKARGAVPHGGGPIVRRQSREYEILSSWVNAGAVMDSIDNGRVMAIDVTPSQASIGVGDSITLQVTAKFANGEAEDVSHLCSFESRGENIADVDRDGRVTAVSAGGAAILIRFGSQPVIAMIEVARDKVVEASIFAAAKPVNQIDERILARLKRLQLPPANVSDDATFLRRVRLDVTGRLPTPDEVIAFLEDKDDNKRAKKIDELLSERGYAALWALKFCDVLGAADFGVYADGLSKEQDAPRFHAWVRARLVENIPYDQFAARILTATSRDGRSLSEWAKEQEQLQAGYKTPRTDLDIYSQRKTLDAYWQRKDAIGVAGTLQIAHAFLGLRLECAQCHRHPHDVWQQDDLLSFANFFMRVRKVGFNGQNEKNYVEEGRLFKEYNAEAKRIEEEVKQLKAGPAKKNPKDKELQERIRELDRRAKYLKGGVAKRVLHAQIHIVEGADAAKMFASVSSPLGTQESKNYRLLGQKNPIELNAGEDPRQAVVDWMLKADNPFFAKAIVNRVWAHYFGRGIVDPPDELSPLNPASHPQLLDDLCAAFIKHKYDLKWLHRTILNSRTYQQDSMTDVPADPATYASFPLRRLPAEVLLDALNQATGTTENMDMKYYHWPDDLRAVDIPYMPRNPFVAFILEQFGRPDRNSSVQCDCERQGDSSLLQILSFANHPRVWQKVQDSSGLAAKVAASKDPKQRQIKQLYLSSVSRLPSEAELQECLNFYKEAASPAEALQSILWALINTKEFILQH